MNDNPRQVVFVHSMWRARSTYIYGQFRATGEFYCYYEPFHELLGSDAGAVASRDQKAIQERLRHSDIGGGYMEEYDGLWVEDGAGVKGYDARLAYHPFDAGNDPGPFIDTLIAHSPKGKVLLQPCRSPFRLRYLVARFPHAQHFFLQRDASDQFLSYHVTPDYFLPLHVAYAYLQPELRGKLVAQFPSIASDDEIQRLESGADDALVLRVFFADKLRDADPPVRRQVFDVLYQAALEDARDAGVTVVNVDDLGELRKVFAPFGLSFDGFKA